jgi:transcription elongation factor GreA
MNKSLLTHRGYQKLLQELKLLRQVDRMQALSELMETTQEGRLEKNPEYQAARARQARVEGRIRQLQHIIANSEVVVGGNLKPTRVLFNSWVKIRNLITGQIQSFHLVGTEEADVEEGHLSIMSPLGMALLGRTVGERIDLNPPGGRRFYQVLEIYLDNY